jgi:serine phosphatase RsbU (regulator of sigma subunit)
MIFERLSASMRIYWVYFFLALLITVVVYTLYGVNVYRWQDSPDFGWRTMYNSGANVVAEVFKAGEAPGIRAGDTVQAINGQAYNTFDELYFKVRNDKPGAVNTYTILRDGKTMEISITNGRLGLQTVLKRSGPIFVIGLIYVIIGVLVFLMKPQAPESRLFFVMTSFIGMEISYGAPSDLMSPLWLYDVRLLIDVFLPAPIIHLALRFPKRHIFLKKIPWLWTVPYLVSLAIFILFKITSTAYWNSPPLLNMINDLYLMLGILVILVSMVWNFLRDTSVTIRLQSQVIFLGIILGFFIPTTDLTLRTFWNTYLFPDPVIGFVIFLSIFPISIGYTIVRHDLFEIDVIVRRTYGYVLSTAAIIGAFVLVQSLLNVLLRTTEVSKSPVFSILFVLGVVFFFKPIHERLQGFVDRVFHRQQYDYRKTIKDVSETMIRILNPCEIYETLIGSAVKEMSLENGVIFLSDPARQGYRVQVAEGIDTKELVSRQLDKDNALLRVIEEKKDAIFRHDLDLHPLFEGSREVLQNTFRSFASELMLPMKYKDEIRGIISLGRKKSGKMFTPQDLDLLKTLTNQSVVALENAKLFEENLEKGRMEEELKIAHDIQVSMLPEKAPSIEGFKIAASSIPAKEVGGDFYDFIEMDGNGAGDKLAIVIGDVSGKAVSGALVMAASRSIFRVLAESHTSVEKVMSIGNVRLNSDVKKGMFVALLYSILDPRQKMLTLSNAGQTQPIICSSGSSAPLYIDTEGDRFPLGIVKDCDYQETKVPLKRGDTLVFYTDGVVEAMNDKQELYGFERFLTSIGDGRLLDANTLLKKLMDDVSHYVGGVEQHDDLTIVVVKVE